MYQAFVRLQPDWCPFNSLGADVVNKGKSKTGKVSNFSHIILLNMLKYTGPTFIFAVLFAEFLAVLASKCNIIHSKSGEFPNLNVKRS